MAATNNIITLHRHDLDNLRTALTILVIAHHVAAFYGGSGDFGLESACFKGKSPLLVAFNGFNQSFFMGLFFWISGRMSAQSLARSQSPYMFLRQKLLRLGVPTLVYSATVVPLEHILRLPTWDRVSVMSTLKMAWVGWRGARGLVWYTATLLMFDLFSFLLAEAAGPLGVQHWARTISYDALSRCGWLGVFGVSFLIRTRYPINLENQLPLISGHPGYLAQYVYAYVLGFLAFHQREPRMKSLFESVTANGNGPVLKGINSGDKCKGRVLSLSKATALSVGTMLLSSAPALLNLRGDQLMENAKHLLGGWTFSAALYALWNEFSFIIVGPALMALFQKRYNSPGTSALWPSRYSYAAYLVHIPLCLVTVRLVDLALCAGGNAQEWIGSPAWKVIGPVVMTVAVTMMNSVAAFSLGRWLVKRVPGVHKVL
jgi:glucan biosynthesis protein C